MTITTKIASKQKKLSKDRVLTIQVVVEFGLGIRIELETISRVTKANGFEVNTEHAYRHHPNLDLRRIVKSEETDLFTEALVQSYIDLLNERFESLVTEVEGHFMALEHI